MEDALFTHKVLTLLGEHDFDSRLISDETEPFEEEEGLRRAARVRQLEFPQFSLDIGAECCYVCLRKDWATLIQEPSEFYRAEGIGISVAAVSGSRGPILIFPNSNLGYDQAQMLSYVASFAEIEEWFLTIHGPPTALVESLLVCKGPAIIGSGYRLAQVAQGPKPSATQADLPH